MASVLLLYYHLLRDGGITNDQTVYIDPDDFNGIDFVGVEVRESPSFSFDLDEMLIQQGAIIYLLCDLNDIISEYEDDFYSQPQATEILAALKKHQKSPIPEIASLFELLPASEAELDYGEYQELLKAIYNKYVQAFFVAKFGEGFS